MKCGTTTLYKNLVKHPAIISAKRKELHFFDKEEEYEKGLNWYRKQFPLLLKGKFKNQSGLITGEATPRYLFTPDVPQKVYEAMPGVKLIVILRNPVERAYSHYHHFKRRNLESLSFEEALCKEENGTIEPGINRNYLARGIYVEQLKRWMKLFPKEQFLILQSENYYKDPIKGLNQVCNFLNVGEWDFEYMKGPSYPYPKMNEQTRKKLNEYYQPFNQELYEFLGVNFNWE